MACKGFFTETTPNAAGDPARRPGPRTAVWAHRGRGGGHRENSLEAFAWARDLGAQGVELDVHLTADGELAVHHDEVVPGCGPIAGLRGAELPAHVPLLADALAVCGGMVVNIEIKAPPPAPGRDPAGAVAAAVVGSVVATGWAGRVVVSSFSAGVLDAVARASRAAGAEVRLGLLVAPGVDPHTVLGTVAGRGYHCVHPFVAWVDAALVEAAGRAGLAVHVWTVNAPEDLRAMVALGVDAVITDLPVEALTAAGGG